MTTWIQRDGTPIDVRDMTDRHLRNALRMLGRHALMTETHDLLGTYLSAGFVRGEAAADAVEDALRELEEERATWDSTKRILHYGSEGAHALVFEWERRGHERGSWSGEAADVREVGL